MSHVQYSQDEPDPFYDLEEHALLGVANIYVEALHHDVRHEYDAPIIAPTGKVRVYVKVRVHASLVPRSTLLGRKSAPPSSYALRQGSMWGRECKGCDKKCVKVCGVESVRGVDTITNHSFSRSVGS